MRKKLHKQRRLSPVFGDHAHARELAAMSETLDERPIVLNLVEADLVRGLKNPNVGREGMTAEQVLRVLVLKQLTGFSYERLAFHLEDSKCYRRFARFGFADETPKKTSLQRDVSRLRAETIEQINRCFLRFAKQAGIEKGRTVRTDSTATETNIHPPQDSSLLHDVVRVLCREMAAAKETPGVAFTDHTKRSKRRHIGITQGRTKKAKRLALYRDLLKVTRKTLAAARNAVEMLMQTGDLIKEGAALYLQDVIRLGERVVRQTVRRVLKGERVPAAEKLVSIFEEHTDIIVRGGRKIEYGHKVNLTTGRSGLVLDCVVERGNPSDSSRAVVMVERQKEIYGRVPRQIAFDGGYASKANLAKIKELGVKDVSFSKKRGMDVEDMVKSPWVYRNLKRFRAGIEGGISYLKRCFGLDRCLWRGEEHFHSYVCGSVLSHNLLVLARSRLAAEDEARKTK